MFVCVCFVFFIERRDMHRSISKILKSCSLLYTSFHSPSPPPSSRRPTHCPGSLPPPPLVSPPPDFTWRQATQLHRRRLHPRGRKSESITSHTIGRAKRCLFRALSPFSSCRSLYADTVHFAASLLPRRRAAVISLATRKEGERRAERERER